VTAGTVAQFVRDNPGVKILHLDGCRNVGTEALAVVGTSCKALKKLSLNLCELTCTDILKGCVYTRSTARCDAHLAAGAESEFGLRSQILVRIYCDRSQSLLPISCLFMMHCGRRVVYS
jgi:hypothetical protein